MRTPVRTAIHSAPVRQLQSGFDTSDAALAASNGISVTELPTIRFAVHFLIGSDFPNIFYGLVAKTYVNSSTRPRIKP